ncbi:MAG: diaminopimelate decarboxylase, partial [Solobacterium sp.]|nr:diaminopimelate decarboxylase [Solobacterium sp.]
MNTERLMELKEKYGTPLQIYDTDTLKEKMHTFLKSFQTDGIETGVIYASKAFNCKAMLRMVNEEGLYLDVVSGGELYTAKQVDFPMDKIFFHGNNKTLAELEMAKEYGVKYIVCDNAMEAEVIDELWKDAEKEIHVLLRLNPGITAHTHEYIVTAHVDSKFGIALEDKEELMGIINMFQKNEKIIFEGFHSHIGSQIFEAKAYEALIEKLMSYVKELRDVYALEVSMLNLGGGFAAYYTEE